VSGLEAGAKDCWPYSKKIKPTGNNRRYNIVSHCLMAQGASLRQYNGAESTVPSLVLTQRLDSFM